MVIIFFRYYYHPDGLQSRTEGESSYIIPIVNDTNRASDGQNAQQKRLVAPYTIMVVQDSEENVNNSAEEGTSSASAARTTLKRNHNEISSDYVLTSDSSSSEDNSEDDDYPKSSRRNKRKRNFVLESDCDIEEVRSPSTNGRVVSEVVDSDDSENGDGAVSKAKSMKSDKRQSSSPSSLHLNCFTNSSSNLRQIDCSHISNDAHCPNLSNCTNLQLNGHSDNRNNTIDSDIEISNNINQIIPISSLSTDTDGSVLFDLDQNSLTSSFDLQSNVDLFLPTTPNCKIQNKTNNNNNSNKKTFNGKNIKDLNECDEVNTPDSGVITTLPSSTEKSEDEEPCCSSSATSFHYSNDVNSQKVKDYTFKKRLPKCGLKNYRIRSQDEDP